MREHAISRPVAHAAARRSVWIAALWLVAPALLSVPRVSLAQGLETVVVTAQKREQEMQDVGVSVTALTSDEMRLEGVTGPLTLSNSVPALQFNSASGGDYGAQLVIRGIAQSDYSPHQESPNSMYIDEVYVSAPNAQSASTFDVVRVEVLRGPQGTLFGRNSTGGLVNFITAKPTDKFTGYLDLTGGAFEEIRAEGAVSGPLTAGIRGRLSALVQRNDGYVENHFPGQPDLNNKRFWGVRGQIEADIADNLLGRLSVTRLDDRNREGFYGHVNTFLNPALGGRADLLPPDLDAWGTGAGNDLQGYRSPYTGNEGDVSYVGFLDRDITLPVLRFEWRLGGATLTSLTSYLRMNFNFNESCSGAPQLTCNDPYTQKLDQWSQEFRLNGQIERLTWVGGLYGLYVDSRSQGAFASPYYSGTPFAYDSFNPIRQRVNTFAVFGQGEWMFSDKWRGTLGLRLTRDEKTFSSQTYLKEAGDLVSSSTVYNPPLLIYDFSSATVGGLATETNTQWSGKAQLDYILSKGSLLYASFSRGIKGAGFNANATGGTPIEQTPFHGETVNVYEIGEKLTLLNDRLRLNSAVYYYDYRDFQGYQLRFGVTPFVSNNDARFVGTEVEVAARPVDALDLRLSATYLDTRVYDVGTAAIGIVDQQASDAPRWTANWLARYKRPMGMGVLYLQYSGDYVGSKYHSIDNAPAVRVHPSAVHNARIDYNWANHWSASVFVNNFTDKVRETNAYDLTASYGYSIRTYALPRWWGASLRYSF